MRISRIVIFVFVLFSFVLSACKGNRKQTDVSGNVRKVSLEFVEDRVHGDDFKWKMLCYSDGTYGAEVDGKTVLAGCENKIYCTGYNGEYFFKTLKGRDSYAYDLNGNELFCLKGIEYLTVNSYMSNNILKNGYILVEDFNDRQGVYDLRGNEILSPQFSSIDEVLSNLGGDEWVIWGFICRKSNTSVEYVYDLNGNFVLSGKYLYQKSKGVLPTFVADNADGDSGFYNHKGERLFWVDDYSDFEVEVTGAGVSYIVLETDDDVMEGRDYSELEWIDVNGNTLKKLGRRRDNVAWNDNADMTQHAKTRLRESMRAFTGSYASKKTYNSQPSSTNNDYNLNWGNGQQVDVNNPVGEDNYRWEQHYRSTYRKYEERVMDLFRTLNTLQTTGNGGGTSSYAISQTKSSIRDIQSEMARVRNEAQQYKVYISASSWESMNY